MSRITAPLQPDAIHCDFCQEVITDPDSSLTTILRQPAPEPTSEQHFDVCGKCGPYTKAGYLAFAAAVLGNRRAAEAAAQAAAQAAADAEAARIAALEATMGLGSTPPVP